jgi:integrase
VFINYRGQRWKKYFGMDKALAKDFARTLDAKLKLGEAGIMNKSRMKLEAYAVTWLDRIQHSRKHTTYNDYRKRLDHDILPVLKGLDLEDITREKVKAMCFAGLRAGQSPKTVQNTVRVLSCLLTHAKEDGLVRDNPAMRPGLFLPKVPKHRAVDPFTREEVITFLNTVRAKSARYYPFFLCAVRTGLRMGELLGLQWGGL